MTRAPHEMVDRYFSESEGVRLPVRVRAPPPRSNPHRGHRVPAPPPPGRRDRSGTLVPDRCGPPVWQRHTKAERDSSTRVRRGDVASRAKPSCTVGALTRADLWRRRVAPSPSWFEVAQLELLLRSMDFSPQRPQQRRHVRGTAPLSTGVMSTLRGVWQKSIGRRTNSKE